MQLVNGLHVAVFYEVGGSKQFRGRKCALGRCAMRLTARMRCDIRSIFLHKTVLRLETMPNNEQTWCIGGQLEARVVLSRHDAAMAAASGLHFSR